MSVTFQLLSTLFTGFFAKKKPEAKRNLWTSNEVKNSGLGLHIKLHVYKLYLIEKYIFVKVLRLQMEF